MFQYFGSMQYSFESVTGTPGTTSPETVLLVLDELVVLTDVVDVVDVPDVLDVLGVPSVPLILPSQTHVFLLRSNVVPGSHLVHTLFLIS